MEGALEGGCSLAGLQGLTLPQQCICKPEDLIRMMRLALKSLATSLGPMHGYWPNWYSFLHSFV